MRHRGLGRELDGPGCGRVGLIDLVELDVRVGEHRLDRSALDLRERDAFAVGDRGEQIVGPARAVKRDDQRDVGVGLRDVDLDRAAGHRDRLVVALECRQAARLRADRAGSRRIAGDYLAVRRQCGLVVAAVEQDPGPRERLVRLAHGLDCRTVCDRAGPRARAVWPGASVL